MRPTLLAAVRAVVSPLLRPDAGTSDAGTSDAGTPDSRTHDARTPDARTIVGIAGPPGAGKSTLARELVDSYRQELGPGCAVVVGMDGFHLSNAQLVRLGLTERKGAPETFDALGFVHLLRRIRAGTELVYAPAFDRALNESIGGVVAVEPDTRLVVVEGNYLLVPDEPWGQLRGLLDMAIFIDATHEQRWDGLVRRQRSRGLDEEQARDWVRRSDEANARLVAATRPYADVAFDRW